MRVTANRVSLTNECVSVSYKEGRKGTKVEENTQRWECEEDKDKKEKERALSVCRRRTGRRGGLQLVRWHVTSAACWIEVLCPADFNPNSLRNREQVPVQTLWGEERKWQEKAGTPHNLSGEISGANLQPESLTRREIKHFIFASHSHACSPSLPFPCFVLNLFAGNFDVWPDQACLRTEATGLWSCSLA